MQLKDSYIQHYEEKDILKKIEKIARICWKSDDKIKEEVNIPFLRGLVGKGHTSILEHGILYFILNRDNFIDVFTDILSYQEETFNDVLPYFKFKDVRYVIADWSKCTFVSTNVRTIYTLIKIVEEYPQYKGIRKLLSSLFKYSPIFNILPEFDKHEEPFEECMVLSKCLVPELRQETYYIETSRAIHTELCRHRSMSPTVSSTRYVNYVSEKENGEIKLIEGRYFKSDKLGKMLLNEAYKDAEGWYSELIRVGVPVQNARDVLPLGAITEMYMSGYLYNWNKFLNLRCDFGAHPDAREIAVGINQDLYEKYPEVVVPYYEKLLKS